MNDTGTSKGKETINGVIPAKSNCYTIAKVNGAARIVKSSEMRRYERNFIKQCTRYKGIGINQPFILLVDVYYPDYTHDLDNALKGLLDCLQQVGAITNDKFCTRIEANRHHDKNRPRVEFEIIVPNEQLKINLQ